MHVGGLIRVPKYSLMMDILSTQSGTCNVPRCLSVRQSVQPHILLQHQSSQVVVSGSLDHVLQSLCRRREKKHGRRHVFSRWQVGGGSK